MKSLCKHVGRESRFMGLCYECAPMRDSGSAEVGDVLLRYARGVREKEKLRQRAFRLRISGILSGSTPPPTRPTVVEDEDAETKAEMETPAYKAYQAEVQRKLDEMRAEKPALTYGMLTEEERAEFDIEIQEITDAGDKDQYLAKKTELLAMFAERRAKTPRKEGV